MSKKKIIWISIAASIALAGVFALQVYWFFHEYNSKQEQFDRNVRMALHDLRNNLADKQAYRFIFEDSMDMIHLHNDKTSLQDKIIDKRRNLDSLFEFIWNYEEVKYVENSQSGLNQDINIRIESFIDSSNTVQTKIWTHNDTFIDHSDNFQPQLQMINERQFRINNLLDDFMQSELIDKQDHLSKIQIDSILYRSLSDYGIQTKYDYALIQFSPFKQIKLISNPQSEKDVLHSSYNIPLDKSFFNLNPDILYIHFPSRIQYVLSSMFWLLGASVVLSCSLVLLFFYTIRSLITMKNLSDMKNDFINNMTHEFKTPIATIGLAVDSLNKEGFIDHHKQNSFLLDMIRQENQRMNIQVERVLQAAQLEKGDIQLIVKELNINDVLTAAVHKLNLLVESKQGSVQFKELCDNAFITGDHEHLTNVFINIIENSLKYSDTNPIVEISTKNLNNMIVVSIKDNGIGMDNTSIQKAFDTFYRVSTGNIHNVKGFGLGLSYVKRILDAHNAFPKIESKPGHGTIFTIRFQSVNNNE